MDVLLLSPKQLASFVDGLIRAVKTIGVKRKDNKFAFGELADASELVLDYDVTLVSPRVFFQPPREKLLDFTAGPRPTVTAHIEQSPLVLIGVHPYDLKALNQMDRIWAETNADEHYLARRRAATIVALTPARASKWSFWASMDAAEVKEGFDLLLTDIGGRYTIEIGTEKGRALLARHAPDAVDATSADLEARERVRGNLAALCPPDRAVKVKPGEITPLMRRNLKHPIWERQAKSCYSCGSCNLVCPTCYCFDVKDDLQLDLTHGTRIRNWDACLLEEFARVGSGENFREHRRDRFRHRLLRKTVYVPDKIGELSCVGCGRCSEACLPNITDPVFIINSIRSA